MITYEIDKQQPKKSNKRILEAKLYLFIHFTLKTPTRN